MPKQKFTKTDLTIIVLVLSLYSFVCVLLLKPIDTQIKTEEEKSITIDYLEKQSLIDKSQVHTDRKHEIKSLSDWPLDLGKYYYSIDIDPAYEMEDEEFEVVGKSGDNLLVKRHNDWPYISGHFEWFCNEKLITTQQRFNYVVTHYKAIFRQMQELRNKNINQRIDESSYFQDHYDEYLDDPEDEIRFPPEIFDANED